MLFCGSYLFVYCLSLIELSRILVPFLGDQDQFAGTDDTESAAAAAGAAAAAALAAAERDGNYRKYNQAVKDPFYSS